MTKAEKKNVCLNLTLWMSRSNSILNARTLAGAIHCTERDLRGNRGKPSLIDELNVVMFQEYGRVLVGTARGFMLTKDPAVLRTTAEQIEAHFKSEAMRAKRLRRWAEDMENGTIRWEP